MRRTGSRVHALFARALRVVVIAAVAAVMVPVGVPAASAANVTYWVDIVSGVDDASHGTEAAPFKTITYAVGVADSADSIRVKPGTYSSANGETLPIILSGQTLLSTAGSATTFIEGNGSQQLLIINEWGEGDYLAGFTFENGGTGGNAAVLVNLQTAVSAATRPYISGNVFSNSDNGTGGALVISSPTPGVATAILVQGNTFSDNIASAGGALRYDGRGAVHIVGNTFATNTANSGGAVALFTWDAVCTVSDNSFVQNSATGGGQAGALYWEGNGSSLTHTVDGNVFSSNTAASTGGAVHFVRTRALMDTNFGSYNSASTFGGFAYLEGGRITAENNYFAGHSAGNGGVVWSLDNASALIERNDTLWAQVSGPAAAYLDPGGLHSALEITNCIYWNPNLGWEMQGATVSYSCSSNDASELSTSLNTVGEGMIYAHPQVDTGMGLGMIMPTSPCIDAADPTDFPAYDRFGTPRPLDGDGDRIDEPDIGCYESPDVSPPVTLNPVYRFYNFTNNTHFFTADPDERAIVLATWPHIFREESSTYSLNPANNTAPLYRFYNHVSRSHFYTTSATERAIVNATWPDVFTDEGPVYMVSATQVPYSIPVYRFYNKVNGSHFYTASAAERDIVNATWPHIFTDENVGFYAGQ